MLSGGKHPARLRPYHVAPSMTPLIDIVFLLIVFFMLVAQISRHRTADLDLPIVGGSPRIHSDTAMRVLIDVMPGTDYRITGASPSPTTLSENELAEALAAIRANAGETSIEVRADRTAAYHRVSPVLRAIRDAGFNGADFAVTGEQQGERS